VLKAVSSIRSKHNALSAFLSRDLRESALLDCGFGSMDVIEVPMTELAQDAQATRWSLLARLKNWDDQQSWREFFDTY
jgi:hypothetical protein